MLKVLFEGLSVEILSPRLPVVWTHVYILLLVFVLSYKSRTIFISRIVELSYVSWYFKFSHLSVTHSGIYSSFLYSSRFLVRVWLVLIDVMSTSHHILCAAEWFSFDAVHFFVKEASIYFSQSWVSWNSVEVTGFTFLTGFWQFTNIWYSISDA